MIGTLGVLSHELRRPGEVTHLTARYSAPQRLQRIDAGGAPRRDPGGHERDNDHDHATSAASASGAGW